MLDMTVIDGINEKIADLYAKAEELKKSVDEVIANQMNFVCTMILGYYNTGYDALNEGLKIASTALNAAKKVTSKLKSEMNGITSKVRDAFNMDIINMQAVKNQVNVLKMNVLDSASKPLETLKEFKVPLDSAYAQNIISGLNQVRACALFKFIPSSGKLDMTLLITSKALQPNGISNTISLGVSTYLDKANNAMNSLTDKIDSLPNSLNDIFGDALDNALDRINSTLNDSIFGQLDKIESMYNNALELAHVREICTFMGMAQQYLEDYCTDLEIRKQLEAKPMKPLVEKVGGTVTEIEGTTAMDDTSGSGSSGSGSTSGGSGSTSGGSSSSSTASTTPASRYSYNFDFKKAAGVDDSLQAESIDTTTYTMTNIISTVSVGKYGAEGLRNYLSNANLGKFLPEPYYGYYKDYQSFIQTTSLPEIDRLGYISNKLHLDDEKSRKIFFQGKSYDDCYAIVQSRKVDETIKASFLANKYLAEYGMVDIPLTYDDGSIQIPDCKVLLFAPNEDNFTNAVVCSATITKITVDGSDYKCFTLSPMKSSKTGKVPDFFKSYTGVECTFRNLAEENGDYHMYMFR